jgi:hypothetical protein
MYGGSNAGSNRSLRPEVWPGGRWRRGAHGTACHTRSANCGGLPRRARAAGWTRDAVSGSVGPLNGHVHGGAASRRVKPRGERLRPVWQTRCLVILILATRFALPVFIGVGTWRSFEAGRWQWGVLGAVATGVLAVAAWLTLRLWHEQRRNDVSPTDRLISLLRLSDRLDRPDVTN